MDKGSGEKGYGRREVAASAHARPDSRWSAAAMRVGSIAPRSIVAMTVSQIRDLQGVAPQATPQAKPVSPSSPPDYAQEARNMLRARPRLKQGSTPGGRRGMMCSHGPGALRGTCASDCLAGVCLAGTLAGG